MRMGVEGPGCLLFGPASGCIKNMEAVLSSNRLSPVRRLFVVKLPQDTHAASIRDVINTHGQILRNPQCLWVSCQSESAIIYDASYNSLLKNILRRVELSMSRTGSH